MYTPRVITLVVVGRKTKSTRRCRKHVLRRLFFVLCLFFSLRFLVSFASLDYFELRLTFLFFSFLCVLFLRGGFVARFRSYRAPEVVLGLPYGAKVDVVRRFRCLRTIAVVFQLFRDFLDLLLMDQRVRESSMTLRKQRGMSWDNPPLPR